MLVLSDGAEESWDDVDVSNDGTDDIAMEGLSDGRGDGCPDGCFDGSDDILGELEPTTLGFALGPEDGSLDKLGPDDGRDVGQLLTEGFSDACSLGCLDKEGP